MFIKNYSDTDLTINYRGESFTLESGVVSYVDENWISLAMVKAMFGDYVEKVTDNVPIEEFLFDNQVEVTLDTVYLTRAKGPGTPRIFIKGGTVDVYFSDGKEVPTSYSDMSLFTDYTGIEGLMAMSVFPKWTLFKSASGSPIVILTNVEAIEDN